MLERQIEENEEVLNIQMVAGEKITNSVNLESKFGRISQKVEQRGKEMGTRRWKI